MMPVHECAKYVQKNAKKIEAIDEDKQFKHTKSPS